MRLTVQLPLRNLSLMPRRQIQSLAKGLLADADALTEDALEAETEASPSVENQDTTELPAAVIETVASDGLSTEERVDD